MQIAGLEDYYPDKDAENEGIVVHVTPEVWFRIRRAGGSNGRFQRAVRKLDKRGVGRRRNDERYMDEVAIPAFAEAVVVGWGGLKDAETGRDVPFSTQTCINVFRGSHDLFGVILDAAMNRENFIAEAQEEQIERLGESSSGP